MEVVITKASHNERPLFENLLQLYIYDFTEFTNAPITENGLYKVMPDFDTYWNNSDKNHPFLIRADGEIAGFILTRDIDVDRTQNYLAHFFVLRKFRRLGVGRRAAELILNCSRGEWELYQLENNIPAQKFWDRVIEELACGEVKIRFENGRRYQNFFVSE